jgi:hypothetical protein
VHRVVSGFRRFGKTQTMRELVRERLERGESLTLFVTASTKSQWDDLVREFPEKLNIMVPVAPLPIPFVPLEAVPPGVRVERWSEFEDAWFY